MNLLKLLVPLGVVATTALADPLTIQSCGIEYTFEKAPARAITLNQQATEVTEKVRSLLQSVVEEQKEAEAALEGVGA